MPKETDFLVRPAGQWNHYRITALDGTVTLEVNGRLVSAGLQCSPAKGYLCLASEGGEVQVRNFRIWELPVGSHSAGASQTAQQGESHRPLYNGLDLNGWKVSGGEWKATDWQLTCAAGGGEMAVELPAQTTHLIVDFQRPGTPETGKLPLQIGNTRFDAIGESVGEWSRIEVSLTDTEAVVECGGRRQVAAITQQDRSKLSLITDGVATEFCNVLARVDQ
jgi:hypothetical protein